MKHAKICSFEAIKLTTRPSIFRCEKHWHWDPPPLSDYDLWYIVEGVGEMRLKGKSTVVTAGSCFLLRPGDKPFVTHDPLHPLVVFYVHFTLQKAIKNTLPVSLSLRESAFFTSLAFRCERAFRRGDELGKNQAILFLQAMLLHFCEEGMDSPSRITDERIQAIIHAIHLDPRKRWNIGELARQAHLSRSQFTRLFTKIAGMSPASFSIRTRLARAQHLLSETNLTISEIADALDYKDVFFFSKQYKKYMGHAPSKFRARRHPES
ncbi:MAG: AraC family transcriptional regulator [Chthoniobacterales bacterium]